MVTKIVPRAIRASFALNDLESRTVECKRGLLQPFTQEVNITKYSVADWCILVQSNANQWECLKKGDIFTFSESPFKGKLCPGTVHLKIEEIIPDQIMISLDKEACWKELIKGFAFCDKHFNTYYGQYIRYVFGSGRPNLNNPFFRLPAFLYTIYYGDRAIKIGTTIILKGFRRFLEQPSYLTSILYLSNNIVTVRKLEIEISKNCTLSQAPRMSKRTALLIQSIKKGDFYNDVSKYTCTLINELNLVIKRKNLKEVREFLSHIQNNKLHINYMTGEDKFIINSKILEKVEEVNKALSGRECAIRSYTKGFLILDCNGQMFSLPYELIRDRLIIAKSLNFT